VGWVLQQHRVSTPPTRSANVFANLYIQSLCQFSGLGCVIDKQLHTACTLASTAAGGWARVPSCSSPLTCSSPLLCMPPCVCVCVMVQRNLWADGSDLRYLRVVRPQCHVVRTDVYSLMRATHLDIREMILICNSKTFELKLGSSADIVALLDGNPWDAPAVVHYAGQ
jgi:hypothetical protein